MDAETINSLPPYFWFQLSAVIGTGACIITTLVWSVSRMTTGIERTISAVDHKVDLVQHTVEPYAAEISELKVKGSEDRQRLSRLEGAQESTAGLLDRDIKRLEARIAEMQRR